MPTFVPSVARHRSTAKAESEGLLRIAAPWLAAGHQRFKGADVGNQSLSTRRSLLNAGSVVALRCATDRHVTGKSRRRFPGFDETIASMVARGMSMREIQDHLRELYCLDVAPDRISAVTDAVPEEVPEWQNRPRHRHADQFLDVPSSISAEFGESHNHGARQRLLARVLRVMRSPWKTTSRVPQWGWIPVYRFKHDQIAVRFGGRLRSLAGVLCCTSVEWLEDWH